MTTAVRTRHLITEGNPDDPFLAPDESTFFDGETGRWSDFLSDPTLSKIGQALIQQKLTHLDDGEFTVDFRWRRRGGVSKGHAMLANCVKLAGVARHYANTTHMLVYLAADHLEVAGFTRWQVEALLYHELLKVEREERWSKPDKLTKKATRLPTVYRVLMPDVSAFYQEIAEYGLWHYPLERLGEVIQPSLPGFDN